jgi:SAM-dependent methyltransferase
MSPDPVHLRPTDFWERRYQLAEEPRRPGPHDLARVLNQALPPRSAVLELGCGDGRDALYFADSDHRVVACDFAETALCQFGAEARELHVEQLWLDLARTPYDFAPNSFDAVYARLSLHYFPALVTRRIFGEIARVLRPDGIFLGLFNSHFDPENGCGTLLEDRYFELEAGSRKRFFTTDDATLLLGPSFRRVESSYVAAGQGRLESRLVQIQARRT